MIPQKLKVIVCRDTGGQNIDVYIDDISEIRWSRYTGGTHKKKGFYSLYGKVNYDFAADNLDCSGRHGHFNNGAGVLILESYNKDPEYKEGYAYLLKIAGEKPQSVISENRPLGSPPCTQMILNELNATHFFTRKELRNRIINEHGYKPLTFQRAMKSLSKGGRIILEGSSHSPLQIIKKAVA